MQPNEMNNYFHLLYTELQRMCKLYPYDTGNMYRHIIVAEKPDCWEIYISAPKNTGDYARYVNEAAKAIKDNRPMSKAEAENYHWIERAILRTNELFTGEKGQVTIQ